MTSSRPKLTLTTLRQYITAVLAGAALGLLIINLFDAFGKFPPVVPWTLPGMLVVASVGAWIYARKLPQRIEDRVVSSSEGLAAVGTAKSMVMTGAALLGGHVIYVGRWIGQISAPQPAQRVYWGLATLVVSAVFSLAGYTLEKACIVNVDDDDQNSQKNANPGVA